MGLFNSSIGYVKGSMQDVRYGTRFSANWLKDSVFGAFAGTSDYWMVRNSAQSYTLRQLLDTKISKKSFKAMHKSKKHISYYASPSFQGRLEQLFNRYAQKNPGKLAKKCSKYIKKALKDTDKFLEAYRTYITALNDELLKEKQMLTINAKFLGSIVSKLNKAIASKKINMPEEIIEDTKKQLKKLLEKEEYSEVKAVYEDRQEERGGSIRSGFLRFLGGGTGASFIIHKSKKLVKRWKNRTMKDFKKNMDALSNELNAGQVSFITLSRFLNHIRNMKRNEPLLEQIAHDARLCMEVGEREFNDLIKSLSIFVSLFRGAGHSTGLNREIDNLIVELNKLRQIGAEAKKVLAADEANSASLANNLDKMLGSVDEAFDRLKRVARSVLEQIEAKPELVFNKV
jgi:hypothetical protein